MTDVTHVTKQKAFPFFVGCGRSGTTLLRAIFDSHPALSIPPETQFIVSMGSRRARYETASGIHVDRFLADAYRATDLGEHWSLAASDVRGAWAAAVPRDYADAIRSLFGMYAHRRGKLAYGSKTPIHVLSLALLAELFPEARFVHMIRDGRDVALSYLASDFGPTTVEGAALRWRHWTGRGIVAGRKLHPSRYREVRYEQLVDDPEQVTRELCDFLDLAYDEAMLSYTDRADELLRGVTFQHHHQGLRRAPTKGLRDWRTQMSIDDVGAFEAVAGRLLDRLGYERGALSPRPSRRVAAAGRRAVADLRRVVGDAQRRLVSR